MIGTGSLEYFLQKVITYDCLHNLRQRTKIERES